MNIKCVLILFLIQVLAFEFSLGRFLFSNSLKDLSPFKFSSVSNPRNRMELKRGRRCLGTALTLLWPQVVGPVDQGIINEPSYQEVPKTLLEYRLDMIRKKAAQEEEKRLMVRNYLKQLTEAQDKFYGYSVDNNSIEDVR